MSMAVPKTICCPVCNQALKNPALEIHQITEIRMTKHRKRILEKLIAAYPRRVERDDIIEAVYFDCAKDGPEWAIHCLYSMVLALNKKLNGYGWQIKGHGKGMGNIPSYQLINISEGAE
jgi:DNA-binding winged helix-turn-helix (wHTH) protein